MSTTKNVNILELAKGAIAEQIDIEVAKAMANIVDPNTDAKTARKLTVTITLKPDENRETISISAQAKAALAPIKPISTTLMVGIDRDGKPVAVEPTKQDHNQMQIFGESEPTNVVKMRHNA
ncbi:hypothetical protein [Desulfitobacterium hafniense]|uniref:hypothetical protein n=1 Tax=Desulfitobacterium hafniense TaxID=49338 RepID=UPI00036A7CB7|nr:hypothetical protein [Desulfitobacterium hafniense]